MNELSIFAAEVLTGVNSLRDIAAKSRKHAVTVQKHYLKLQNRRKNELKVLSRRSTLTAKSQYTPTWGEWLTSRRKGLRGDEIYDVVGLDIQWRDLKELESIPQEAKFYLRAAIEILDSMRANLESRSRDIGHFAEGQLQDEQTIACSQRGTETSRTSQTSCPETAQ